MKLAFNINAFDASELLFDLISQIRDQVDWVSAIWQKKSYWKNPMDPKDMEELQHLKSIGIIDELIEFKPNWLKPSREQETDKRNMGIELARQKGFTHVISADADEYYDAEQFRNAKNIINEKGWPITYWSYVNYFRDLEHYLVYPFRPFVPGIHSTFFTYTFNGPAPGPTDPTRRIMNPLNIGTYVFEDNEIRMQHLAWIRKNIRKKLENWSAKDHFDPNLINKAVKQFENWKEGDSAIMLFNVPSNEVVVKRLEKRITSIKIPWVEAEMERWKTKQIENAKKEAK
jgi:hypothetical protein